MYVHPPTRDPVLTRSLPSGNPGIDRFGILFGLPGCSLSGQLQSLISPGSRS
jgi:hypothetical protein